MGSFLATVDTPVMASPKNLDHQENGAVGSVSALSLNDLPPEMIKKIVSFLDMSDTLNLGRTNEKMWSYTDAGIIEKKLKKFIEEGFKNEKKVQAFLAVCFARSLLLKGLLPKELGQCILEEDDKKRFDSLKKSSEGDSITLIDFIELVKPICGPDNVHLIKNFLRHKAVHQLISICLLDSPWKSLWKFFQENPDYLDTLDPNFVKKYVNLPKTFPMGEITLEWKNDPYTFTLEIEEKFSKFLKFMSSLIFIPGPDDLPTLKWLRENCPKATEQMTRGIQLRVIPLPVFLPTLQWMKESYPEATEQMIRGIQLRSIPSPDDLPTLQWMRESYPEALEETIKNIQLRSIPSPDYLPTLQWIKDNYPNQFDRIVKDIYKHPLFQELFPGYESPIAWSRLIKQWFVLKLTSIAWSIWRSNPQF